MLRVKWARSKEDNKAIVAANRAGEPQIPGLCDWAWINGGIKLGEDAQEVLRLYNEREAAWKAWNALEWKERNAVPQPALPGHKPACTAPPEPGVRFCKAHGWPGYRDCVEPNLKRQAKAREALKKLTKGMTRTVEADGTEVYE